MEMQSVASSAILAIGYDESTQQMKIRFKQDEAYDFCRVPKHVFQGLLESNSKGTYYNDYVRGKYQC